MPFYRVSLQWIYIIYLLPLTDTLSHKLKRYNHRKSSAGVVVCWVLGYN